MENADEATLAKSKVTIRLGTVAQPCNSSYLGGKTQEDPCPGKCWAKTRETIWKIAKAKRLGI
jgi:hypothetical protein